MSPKFVTALIQIITSLVEGLLGMRIILKLFGASTQAPFVRWIYDTSEPLLNPFQGMFPSPQLTEGFIVEFSALFALMVYAFLGYIAIEVLGMLVYSSEGRKTGKKRN